MDAWEGGGILHTPCEHPLTWEDGQRMLYGVVQDRSLLSATIPLLDNLHSLFSFADLFDPVTNEFAIVLVFRTVIHRVSLFQVAAFLFLPLQFTLQARSCQG